MAHPLVNSQSCHARVVNWVIRENIRPVELAQYGKILYWASSTGCIFSRIAQLRTLVWQLLIFTRKYTLYSIVRWLRMPYMLRRHEKWIEKLPVGTKLSHAFNCSSLMLTLRPRAWASSGGQSGGGASGGGSGSCGRGHCEGSLRSWGGNLSYIITTNQYWKGTYPLTEVNRSDHAYFTHFCL